MSMHGSYDEYGQNDTADLVRSVALSSAKLWEEVFDRLRQLEHAQGELRAMLGRIEQALPAGGINAALASGVSSPAWPDRAIAAGDAANGDQAAAQTDLFVPGPVDESFTSVGQAPRDAVDLLVGQVAGPVSPDPVDEEPATFFFPPAPASQAEDIPDQSAQWTGPEAIGTPGWTSPRTVRYDEGFTSTDVVGPPTEEVQAIDVTLPERTNAEYFGRHAAGPPPGFAVANGESAPPAVGAEPEIPQVPQVQAPGEEAPYDPILNEQLAQAAQLVEMQASTGTPPSTLPQPPYGFASGTDVGAASPGFEAWDHGWDASRVPLVFAPGTEPVQAPGGDVPPPPPGFGSFGDDVPPPPPGFGSGIDAPPPPPGFGSFGDDVPPPPPAGFAAGDVPPAPPGFSVGAEMPPPPPPGFGSGIDVPPPPPGFGSFGDELPPPPPAGFAAGDVPPAPPGFSVGAEMPPPPPAGFGTFGDDVPPAPPGFATGPVAPPPPPGFTTGSPLAGPDGMAPPPAPPVGFASSDDSGSASPAAAPPPPPGFSAGAPQGRSVAPPPPPGFATGANGQVPAASRMPNMGGSITDDVLAIGSFGGAEAVTADDGPEHGNGSGSGSGNGSNGNGHGPADDAPPPPITPDFFARAGRRRR